LKYNKKLRLEREIPKIGIFHCSC